MKDLGDGMAPMGLGEPTGGRLPTLNRKPKGSLRREFCGIWPERSGKRPAQTGCSAVRGWRAFFAERVDHNEIGNLRTRGQTLRVLRPSAG